MEIKGPLVKGITNNEEKAVQEHGRLGKRTKKGEKLFLKDLSV